MSLHNLAKHVQQKGRGKDQMLVHMTPREVQGLQALAKANGGSLTINPETGLAEAGFLEDVLPIVAMAAATYFTAGAAAPALSTALGSTMAGGIAAGSLAGAGVGAIGAAAQDKDVGKGALYGGIGGAISGGMGAYDGAASADLFSGAPSATPSPDVVNKVALDTAGGAQIPGASGAPADVSNVYSGLAGQPTVAPGTMPPVASPTEFVPQDPFLGSVPTYPSVPVDPAGVTPKAGTLDLVGESYAVPRDPTAGYAGTEQGVVNPAVMPQPPNLGPPSYYSKLGSGIGDTATKGLIQAAPGIGADIGMNENANMGVPGTTPYTSASTLSPNFQGYTPRQPKPYYEAQYTRYAADGGLMALSSSGDPAKKKKQRASLTADRTMASMGADQAGLAMLNNARYGANMTNASPLRSSMSLGDLPNPVGAARGGLADLGSYSDGGRMLKGPGDGMSDSIPAQIGRKQPARLADGEFVVPADVVSHLGNGSTDAGAKRLYAMMDKVRAARTGKKKQAPAVNADKILSRVA